MKSKKVRKKKGWKIMGLMNFLGRLLGKKAVTADTIMEVAPQKPLERFIEQLGFKGKPQSLGEGLARVKKAIGAVGEPTYSSPSYRVYTTPNKNKVVMDTHGNMLNIGKSINKFNSFREYAGQPGSITRWYKNEPLADHKFEINRRTFVDQIEDQIQFPDLLKKRKGGFIDTFHLVKPNASHNIDIPNKRVISIQQARNMGMKV